MNDEVEKVGTTKGLKHDVAWWVHAARNGNKILVISFMMFVSSFLIFGASIFIYKTSNTSDHIGLCDYESPRKILTSVKGIEGPAVEERGQIVQRASQCVEGKDLLNVLAYRTFRNVDTNMAVQDLSGESQNRSRGIITTDVPIQLPPKVVAGMWKLEGVDVVTSTGELRTWFSEPFFVVAK